jgi:hypothetical protein
MDPGKQPGIMVIGPADAKGVVAGDGNFQHTKISGNRRRVQQRPTGHFVNAHGTATVLPDELKRHSRNVLIVPCELKNTQVSVHANVLRRNHVRGVT